MPFSLPECRFFLPRVLTRQESAIELGAFNRGYVVALELYNKTRLYECPSISSPCFSPLNEGVVSNFKWLEQNSFLLYWIFCRTYNYSLFRPITFPHRMESVMQTPSILRGPIGYGHVLKNVSTGRILQDSNEACICNEEFVQIINVNDGDVTQEWKCSYGKIYYMTVAMCSTHQFIIVAASSDAASSIIVILKVPSLTVLNLFFFPGEVTCLSMLTSNAEFCISNNCCLSRSDEILAVGSHGGKVHLLGLNISRSLSKPGHHPISLKLVDHRASLEEAFHDGHSAVVLFQGIFGET